MVSKVGCLHNDPSDESLFFSTSIVVLSSLLNEVETSIGGKAESFAVKFLKPP